MESDAQTIQNAIEQWLKKAFADDDLLAGKAAGFGIVSQQEAIESGRQYIRCSNEQHQWKAAVSKFDIGLAKDPAHWFRWQLSRWGVQPATELACRIVNHLISHGNIQHREVNDPADIVASAPFLKGGFTLLPMDFQEEFAPQYVRNRLAKVRKGRTCGLPANRLLIVKQHLIRYSWWPPVVSVESIGEHFSKERVNPRGYAGVDWDRERCVRESPSADQHWPHGGAGRGH